MTLLGWWVGARVQQGVVYYAAGSAALHVEHLLEPYRHDLLPGNKLHEAQIRELTKSLKNPRYRQAAYDFKIWSRSGEVLFALNSQYLGRTFPLTPMMTRAFAGNIEALFDLKHDHEGEPQRSYGAPLLEVYVPIRFADTGDVIAVAEIYEFAGQLEDDLHSARLQAAVILASIGLVMVAALFSIVRPASRVMEQNRRRLRRQVADLASGIRASSAEQKKALQANHRSAQTDELLRRRISADLHDGPMQMMALALLKLDSIAIDATLGSKISPSLGIAHHVTDVQSALREALAETRQIAGGLALPELSGRTLGGLVTLAANKHERRTGTPVTMTLNGNCDVHLPSSMSECLYRFVQEGLNNAHRHANGLDQRLQVTLLERDLCVVITDGGPGFTIETTRCDDGKLGLRGLRNRVEAFGGDFRISSSQENGTSLSVKFTLSRVEC